MSDPLVLTGVEKQYGGLRPLRVRGLRVAAGSLTVLAGFDRPAAETFVNLITGAALPEAGEVTSLGRPTASIANSDEWLSFVEQFGIVSDRIVLLEGMTVAQNLAISFDLSLEPVPDAVMARVLALAAETHIAAPQLDVRVAEAAPLLRWQVYLARALAFDPAVLVLEHPGAGLAPADAAAYAAIVKRVVEQRRVTAIGLVSGEEFARNTGGRLLVWQPATGEMRAPSRLALWRGRLTSRR